MVLLCEWIFNKSFPVPSSHIVFCGEQSCLRSHRIWVIFLTTTPLIQIGHVCLVTFPTQRQRLSPYYYAWPWFLNEYFCLWERCFAFENRLILLFLYKPLKVSSDHWFWPQLTWVVLPDSRMSDTHLNISLPLTSYWVIHAKIALCPATYNLKLLTEFNCFRFWNQHRSQASVNLVSWASGGMWGMANCISLTDLTTAWHIMKQLRQGNLHYVMSNKRIHPVSAYLVSEPKRTSYTVLLKNEMTGFDSYWKIAITDGRCM